MPLNTDTKTKETVWCHYSVGEVSSLPRLHIRLSEWTVSVKAHLLFIATPKMDGGTKWWLYNTSLTSPQVVNEWQRPRPDVPQTSNLIRKIALTIRSKLFKVLILTLSPRLCGAVGGKSYLIGNWVCRVTSLIRIPSEIPPKLLQLQVQTHLTFCRH